MVIHFLLQLMPPLLLVIIIQSTDTTTHKDAQNQGRLFMSHTLTTRKKNLVWNKPYRKPGITVSPFLLIVLHHMIVRESA